MIEGPRESRSHQILVLQQLSRRQGSAALAVWSTAIFASARTGPVDSYWLVDLNALVGTSAEGRAVVLGVRGKSR